MQKRKKRRVKGPSRLSFSDEIDGDTDEESEAVGMYCYSLLYLLNAHFSALS